MTKDLILWGALLIGAIVIIPRVLAPKAEPTTQTSYSLFNFGLGSGVG